MLKVKRFIYWEDADQLLDFTTIDDAADFTAADTLAPSTPGFLRFAGDQINACRMAEVASEVTWNKFKLFRAGGLRSYEILIKISRALFFASKVVYPP